MIIVAFSVLGSRGLGCTRLSMNFRSYVDYVGRGASDVTKFHGNWQVMNPEIAHVHIRIEVGWDPTGYVTLAFTLECKISFGMVGISHIQKLDLLIENSAGRSDRFRNC